MVLTLWDAEGHLGGCETAQPRVRPDGIVVLPAFSQHTPGLGKRGKQGLVQKLITQPAIEAFDAVLWRKYLREFAM